jgi:hypothetical protein
MTKTTYTMFVANGTGGREIVARNVDAGQAMKIALDHGKTFRPMVACRRGRTHRVYEIARRRPDSRRELVVAVQVPRSSHELVDAFAAADAFVEIFLSDPARFWDGEIMTDEEFARRSAH